MTQPAPLKKFKFRAEVVLRTAVQKTQLKSSCLAQGGLEMLPLDGVNGRAPNHVPTGSVISPPLRLPLDALSPKRKTHTSNYCRNKHAPPTFNGRQRHASTTHHQSYLSTVYGMLSPPAWSSCSCACGSRGWWPIQTVGCRAGKAWTCRSSGSCRQSSSAREDCSRKRIRWLPSGIELRSW